MNKHYLWMAVFAMGLYACSDDTIAPGGDVEGSEPETTEVSPMQHAKLASFAGDQSRVSYGVVSRAADDVQPGSLRLVAEIENPSKSQNGVEGFVIEENGRYLSATCVYYDDRTDTYYATYHMQGNNYNTKLETDVAGIIESFKIGADGKVALDKIYRTADNQSIDFDFNHLYFDNVEKHGGLGNVTDDRIVAVGHLVKPTSTGKKDTQAIIAKVNFDGDASLDYKVVYTGDKILDANGKSLGKEDAQDVNAVLRCYDTYYLATRKGVALLDASTDNMFEPRKDQAGNNYFIKSAGSVKHIANDGGYSKLTVLYLTEDFPEGFSGDDAISAKMAKFDISNNGATRQPTIGYGSADATRLTDVTGKTVDDLRAYGSGWDMFNVDFDRAVAPIDGKNVLFMLSGSESQYYAALGKAGLYFRNDNHGQYDKDSSGRLDFGNRPVNGVYADEGTGNEHHNGFIYVANGSKLTIFNRYRLDEVASFNLPESEIGSANYVVARTEEEYNEFGTRDRIITVAFGQAGVKVFRFSPKNTY